MLTWILDVIALVAGIIPPTLWVIIILGLTMIKYRCSLKWLTKL